MLKEEYAHLSIFKGLTTEQLRLLGTILDLCHFEKGKVIFEQGQVATNLFILVSGEVVVSYKPYDGPPLTVARIRAGGVFGWSAALGHDIYTSSAVADADGEAFRLSGPDLHRFCERNPGEGVILLDRLASVIAERLRNTHAEIFTILSKGMEISNEARRKLNSNG